MKLNILETVVLQRDIPEKHLCRGDIGAIVEVYEPDGIEVEFVTGSGETQALVTLKPNDVRRVSGSDILSVRSLEPAKLNIRGWVLIQNFAPSNPLTVKKYNGQLSPAERINGQHYHDGWLNNLLISASLGGFSSPPQNPL